MDQESPSSDLLSRLALAIDERDAKRRQWRSVTEVTEVENLAFLGKSATFQDWMYCLKENKANSLSDLNTKILNERPSTFFLVKVTTKWARKQSVLARKATQLGLICPLWVLLPFDLAYLKRNNNEYFEKCGGSNLQVAGHRLQVILSPVQKVS